MGENPRMSCATIAAKRQLDFDISTMDGSRSFSTFHVNMVSCEQPQQLEQTNRFCTDFHGISCSFSTFSDEFCGSSGKSMENTGTVMDSSGQSMEINRTGMGISGTGVDEFSLDESSCDTCGNVFMLQPLFQLDDFQHFSERVYSDFSLHLYDVVHEPAGGHNLKRFGDVIPVQCSGKRLKHDSSLDFNLRVRAVSTSQSMMSGM